MCSIWKWPKGPELQGKKQRIKDVCKGTHNSSELKLKIEVQQEDPAPTLTVDTNYLSQEWNLGPANAGNFDIHPLLLEREQTQTGVRAEPLLSFLQRLKTQYPDTHEKHPCPREARSNIIVSSSWHFWEESQACNTWPHHTERFQDFLELFLTREW